MLRIFNLAKESIGNQFSINFALFHFILFCNIYCVAGSQVDADAGSTKGSIIYGPDGSVIKVGESVKLSARASQQSYHDVHEHLQPGLIGNVKKQQGHFRKKIMFCYKISHFCFENNVKKIIKVVHFTHENNIMFISNYLPCFIKY